MEGRNFGAYAIHESLIRVCRMLEELSHELAILVDNQLDSNAEYYAGRRELAEELTHYRENYL